MTFYVDRGALAEAATDAIDDATAHPWPVGNQQVPDAGGGDPAGSFTPYTVVWLLNTTTTAQMAGSDVNNTTVLQLTCVSNIPERDLHLTGRSTVIADRAMRAALAARRAGDLDTSGQTVTLGKIDNVPGTWRDRDDERLWVTHVMLRFWCQPAPAPIPDL